MQENTKVKNKKTTLDNPMIPDSAALYTAFPGWLIKPIMEDMLKEVFGIIKMIDIVPIPQTYSKTWTI